MTRREEIQKKAQEIGIGDIGFCSGAPFNEYGQFIQERNKEKKCYLDVDYHKTSFEVYTPEHYLPKAKSILVLMHPYAMDFSQDITCGYEQVRISKASIGADYHQRVMEQCQILEAYLHKEYSAKTKAYVDTGPLNDKAICLRTGRVKIGRSSLLIHPTFGTRFYIGYIITDLDLNLKQHSFPDYATYFHPFCSTCGRCEKTCPNHAIETFGHINSQRCISYLTQSKQWTEDLSECGEGLTLDGYIYGCDWCQRVCPLNGKVLTEYKEESLVTSIQSIETICTQSNREFKERFGKTSAGWIGNKRFKRNAHQIIREREKK